MSNRDFGTRNFNTIVSSNREALEITYSNTKRRYGVLLIFRENGAQVLQMHYEIDVICLEILHNRNMLFEINRQQVFINQKKPSSIMNRIMDKCGQVLYPLKIEVSHNLEVLEIVNTEEINERWKSESSKLKKNFSGEIVDNCILQMTKVLEKPAEILASIKQNDWFFNLFFYDPNTSLRSSKKTIISKWPIFPNEKPLEFTEGPCKLPPVKTRKDTVVCREAIIRKNNAYKGKKITEGAIHLKYHYQPKTNNVDAIIGSSRIILDSDMIKEKEVSIEIYNQKQHIPKTSQEVIVEDQEKKDIENKKISDKINSKKQKKSIFSVFRKKR